jgi:hypothetical protein
MLIRDPVIAGASMMKYRILTRSAAYPIKGLSRAGIRIIAIRDPAWVSDNESFSIRTGSSGEIKDV